MAKIPPYPMNCPVTPEQNARSRREGHGSRAIVADGRAKQALIVQKRESGMTFPEIAAELDCSVAYVHKRYKKAMNTVIVESVNNIRELEIKRLDRLYMETMKIINTFHPLVQRGEIVYAPVDGSSSENVMDEEGRSLGTPLEDVAPKLNAISKALAIMERRAKFLGLDMPTKTALTDPTGEKEAAATMLISMTPEQLMEEAQKRGLPTTLFQK